MRLHAQSAGKRALLTALLSGSVLAGAQAHAADAQTPAAATPETTGEIVVTAQKRSQYLQDVPISIEAFSAKKLEENQISSFDDYAKLLPSVSFQSFGPGQSQIYFRGVSSGSDANGSHSGPQPTSALYVDEIPLTTIGGAPDLHVYDMERVEALSGPQGTLFGSSSLSGTLRLITKKPNPNKFEAGFDVTGTTFGKGSSALGGVGKGLLNSSGGTIEGFVNVPLAQGIAFRASAFYERDGGYISNVPGSRTYNVNDQNGDPATFGPVSNTKYVKQNFNDTETAGGRAAIGAQIGDWYLEPSVIYQHQNSHGTYLFDPAVGDLRVQDYTPEYGSDEWVQAAMTIKGKIGSWDLTYAGGYFSRTAKVVQDYSAYTVVYDMISPQYATFFDGSGNNIDPTQNYAGKDIYSKLNNELRISSPNGQRWHFTGGVFMERQTDKILADYSVTGLANQLANSPAYTTAVPTCGDDVFCTRVYRVDRDAAIFADGSYDILSNLTLDAGIRYFGTKNSLSGFSGLASSVLPAGTTPTQISQCTLGTGGVDPCLLFGGTVTQHGETHKVNLSWKVFPQNLVYFTYSTGYRPGGRNRIVTVSPYKPDELYNFEVGAKSQMFNRNLTLNVAWFIENWHNVQFGLAPPGAIGVLATYNAGKAQIKGVEGNFNLRLSPVTLSGSASYINAELTTPFCNFGAGGNPDCQNGLAAPAGTPLPIQPKFKGNVTARYDFAVSEYKGWFQVTGNHQAGARQYLTNVIGTTTPLLPNTSGFSTIDLSLGGKFGGYTLEAFIQNALDQRGILTINPICVPSICGAYARDYPTKPREFGLKFSARY